MHSKERYQVFVDNPVTGSKKCQYRGDEILLVRCETVPVVHILRQVHFFHGPDWCQRFLVHLQNKIQERSFDRGHVMNQSMNHSINQTIHRNNNQRAESINQAETPMTNTGQLRSTISTSRAQLQISTYQPNVMVLNGKYHVSSGIRAEKRLVPISVVKSIFLLMQCRFIDDIGRIDTNPRAIYAIRW